MASRIGNHIRSNVVGYIALFCFAMGGTAFGLNGSNTVFSDDIVNGQVRTPDLGTNAVNTAKVTDNSLTGADVNESTLAGLWKLGGNAGTTSSHFLGTTDNKPLNLRVNNARGLRLEPASDGTNQSPNVIGGIADNQVTPGVHSAAIGGGGRGVAADPTTANRVTDHQGTVGGGANNQAGDNAGTVGDATLATVGGGGNNNATGELSTVGGGFFDSATGPRATVGGGESNTASGFWATVAGGHNNTSSLAGATVAGGDGNNATGGFAATGGGQSNTASGQSATVPGGRENTAQGNFSLAAGQRARANDNGAFVWADSNNFTFASTAQDQFNVRATGGARLVSGIDGSGNPTSGLELPGGTSGWSTLVNGQPFDIRVNGARALRISPASDGTNQSPNMVGGSADNSVTSGVYGATIAGGNRALPANPSTANKVTDHQGTVGGGANNQAGDGAGFLDDRTAATVGGGRGNTPSGTGATVAGGIGNTASGSQAAVPGGFQNTAAADYGLAAGQRAKANHQGAFVWADSNNFDFASTAANEFSVRSTGGARFVSAINGATGAPTAGVQLAPGGGSWSSLSDEASKTAIKPASGRNVLRKLSSVPVSTWSYRAQDDSIRHIGPMAQDFYRAFGVGEDRKHIASVDADGIALAAIKGLNRKVERLQRTVASLKKAASR